MTTTVNYLPSWANAKDPSDLFSSDGTVHFSDLKRIGDSGIQYLHGLKAKREPTRAMLVGTGVHHIVLGEREGAKVAHFTGAKRVGKAWTDFEATHDGYDILTQPEWDEAEAVATAVLTDPVAQSYLKGSRYEVPLSWEDGGLKCSTSGVDIVGNGMLGDLKTTNTTEVEKWMRQAFSFSYHCQMAFYRRGAKANGIDVSRGLFLLGVEVKPPYEVVALEMSEEIINLAERTVSLWLEKLKVYAESRQFPGRAQSPVVWTVPAWMREDDEEEDA